MAGALGTAGGRHSAAAGDDRHERDVGAAVLPMSIVPAAVAGGLAMLAVVVGWRGSDLPAHLLRMHLVERDGFEVWNNFWYGGHHTAAYGFAFPVLSAFVGIWTVAVASAALSAFLVDRLIILATGRRNAWASLWFAAGTLTNVAVGRLPFTLGMTVGLLALLLARLDRPLPAVAAAIATAAASPVASAFLSIIFIAWAIVEPRQRRSFVWLAAAALVPVLIVGVLYPQGGTFGFEWAPLLWTVTVCVAFAALVPPQQRLVRMSAVVYAVVAAVAFAVPNPLGSNIVRLGMYAAGPVLLALVPARRLILVALVPPLLWWQWSPAFDALTRAAADPSTTESYYAPVRRFLHSVDADTDRVEGRPHDAPLGGRLRRSRPAARAWMGTPTRSAIQSGVLRATDDRRRLPGLAAPRRSALRRVAGHAARLLRRGGSGIARARSAVPPPGVRQRPLAGVGGRRLPWPRRWPGRTRPRRNGSPSGTCARRGRRRHPSSRVGVLGNGAGTVHPTRDGWIVVRDAKPGVIEVFLDETDVLDLDDPCNSR